MSVTGTLLSIDAPVVGSGAGGNGEFFGQWADIAEEQDVETLWSAGSVDLEALIGVEPDLIVTSASGADSLTDNLGDLQDIAPTIVVDNAGQTWQELAEDLGEATGLESEAEESVREFDAYVADAAGKITVPEGTANIISYNGPGENNPIARAGSAQAGILTELGFEIEELAANGDLLIVGLMLELVQLANHVLHQVGDVAAESGSAFCRPGRTGLSIRTGWRKRIPGMSLWSLSITRAM